MTKCTFHKYGPSGTITRHDGLCVLALNIINEKIYVFLWFWFLTVALFSAVAILYRMVLLLAPGLRASVIQARTLYQVLYCTVLYCTVLYCSVLYTLYQVDGDTVREVLSCPHHGWVDQVSH